MVAVKVIQGELDQLKSGLSDGGDWTVALDDKGINDWQKFWDAANKTSMQDKVVTTIKKKVDKAQGEAPERMLIEPFGVDLCQHSCNPHLATHKLLEETISIVSRCYFLTLRGPETSGSCSSACRQRPDCLLRSVTSFGNAPLRKIRSTIFQHRVRVWVGSCQIR